MTESKKERGRPKFEFDLKQIETMGKHGLTQREMASILGCALSTLTIRLDEKGDHYDKDFSEYLHNSDNNILSIFIDFLPNLPVSNYGIMGDE